MEGMTMISFQNFSFRYEESKDFTLRGIDMTVRTGEFILLTGRSAGFLVKAIKSTDKNEADGALFGARVILGMLMLIVGMFLDAW